AAGRAEAQRHAQDRHVRQGNARSCPMTLGTNNKKSVIALAVLGAGAAVSVYVNFLSGPDIPSSSRSASPAAAPAESPSTMPVAAVSGSAGPKMSPRTRNRSEEFHPALRSKKVDQPVYYTKVDPMIRVDLFKKVQAVEMAAAVGKRNLFQFGAPPAPPAPTPTDAQPIVKPKLIYDRPLAPPPPPQPVKQVEAPPPPI